jgi:hypothetical protein
MAGGTLRRSAGSASPSTPDAGRRVSGRWFSRLIWPGGAVARLAPAGLPRQSPAQEPGQRRAQRAALIGWSAATAATGLGGSGCTICGTPPRRSSFGARADPKVVQRVLGHVTASMTMDLYGHLVDANLWEAARAIGSCTEHDLAVKFGYPGDRWVPVARRQCRRLSSCGGAGPWGWRTRRARGPGRAGSGGPG